MVTIRIACKHSDKTDLNEKELMSKSLEEMEKVEP